ncbi:MAG: LacI family DNA-binding transcriptional regulator [Halanaerobiales bacterium]
MNPTMQDVAKLAGVSPSTVSRVINNSSLVKEETARKVMKAIDKLDYQLNDFARALRTNSSGLIGVMGAGMENPFLAKMLKGIENEALQYNYNIIFCESEGELEEEINYIKLLQQRKIAGLLIITANFYSKLLDVIKESGIPVVFASSYIEDPGFPSVGIDNVAAAYDAVDYLFKAGRRNIGIIRGPYSDTVASRERNNGVRLAFKNNKEELKEKAVIEAEFNLQSGYIAGETLVKNYPELDAVFAFSDEIAIGAIRAFEDNGRKVPDDVYVLGFDNIDFSRFVSPSLTTVAQPAFEIGCKSIEILNRVIDNSDYKEKILLPYKLIVRESTGGKVNRLPNNKEVVVE